MSKIESRKKNHNCEVDSDFEESEMSEISIEDEVDYSFVISDDKLNGILFLKIQFNLNNLLKMKVLEIWKKRLLIFPKVQTTPNQVFVIKGLDQLDTNDLSSIVKTNIDVSCKNNFWSKPIDNSEVK